MTWFKVDDGFHDHQKVVRLQGMKGWQGALSLWTLAGSWASKHLTDGVVPLAIVTRLGCTKKDAQLLVACGLWEQLEDGYKFHDWTKRNPTKEQVEEKREKTRKKVSEWRSNQPSNQVTNDTSNPAPVPTIPDHTPLESPAALCVGDEREESSLALVRRFYAQLLEPLASFPAWSSTNAKHAKDIAEWADKQPNAYLALRAAFTGLQADEWAKKRDYPLGVLASKAPSFHAKGLAILSEQPDEEDQRAAG